MDRCQSEQVWALAVYAAVNAFVISEAEKFKLAFSHCNLVWALGLCGVLTLGFLFERLKGYYRYRNQIADYLKDEKDADARIKEPRSPLNWNSGIWAAIFVLAVAIPFIAMVQITAQ